ncbi:MAG: M48 family metallopeptidase [Pseudomonadales bacterium]
MDFFGAQDGARRKTWQLALLFSAAVVVLIVLTNLLVAIVYAWTANGGQIIEPGMLLRTLPMEYWLWISVGVLGMVGLASLYKYLQVRGGGRAVAESLGGRLVNQSTQDLAERRLLNVVEEMAIASAIPVPPVYVIDEPSINAFAAGFSPDDAVIGVNRGTLDHLSRDELQGVIAHEFSHILNGDSRINLRLIAVLHGILFLSLVGYGLLRGAGMGRMAGRRRGSGGGPVLALGLGLLVIGYAGTFFGNLIKAAVSRQREYLADAASVQFTRNPGGIAGALKKIGAHGAGSSMSRASAKEASHMFFGSVGVPAFLGSLTSTHPPLERRIRAVDPGWDGRYPALAAPGAPELATAQAGSAAARPPGIAVLGAMGAAAAAAASAGAAAGAGAGAGAGSEARGVTPDEVVEAVGRLDENGLEQATRLIGGLPATLRDAAHDPFAGRALAYGLVLEPAGDVRDRQLAHVAAHAERGVHPELIRLLPELTDLDESQKLVLIEMAMPALKGLSEPQYQRFVANLITLIKADSRIDLMEWVLHRILVKELKPHFEGPRRLPVRHGSLRPVAAEAATLMSALAREGAPGTAQMAFDAGMQALEMQGAFDAEDDPNYARLNAALTELQGLKPLVKPRLIKACAATILADQQISPRQAALLQGVAATLDCPIPPSIRTP